MGIVKLFINSVEKQLYEYLLLISFINFIKNITKHFESFMI